MTTHSETRRDYTIPACPAWCAQGAGHDYDTFGQDPKAARHHISKAYGDWAQIMALETMLDGVVVCEAPYISVFSDAEEMNAEQARDLVVVLIEVAQQVERLNRGA